ncbi:glycosyltransferase family 2 protein [Gammaproteobacteria bacterium]|nr:glycosyltransferase family 2 protein [Gammaproteobacteria bacterium]
MPTISIGIPVYNGEKTLGASIDALLQQTYSDFDIIISDNNSTDATATICAEYAEKDTRIRYVKQKDNMEIGHNSQSTLRDVTADYFFWNAHDDVRSKDFLQKNNDFLDANNTFVGSASPNCFDDEKSNDNSWSRFSLEGTTYESLQLFLTHK